MSDRFRLARLGQSKPVAETAAEKRPSIQNTPSLPAIDYAALGKAAPGLPANPTTIPKADAVVLCWAEAEWAPLQHVFVSGAQAMPYSNRTKSSWPGWEKFSAGVPANAPSGLTYWGYYRLVTVGSKSVLLFKSNTHLSEGQTYLEQMIQALIAHVQPKLILSTGTAGGARLGDPIGTVNVVDGGTLFEKTGQPSSWPSYKNAWAPAWSLLQSAPFASQLFAVPTTGADLESLVSQFNAIHKASYTLADLNPKGLNMGAKTPALHDLTPATTLLTATSFVVATTSGNYAQFACVEMDDAVIGKVCDASQVAFGFVRNVSDPVQSAALPTSTQGDWGSFVYDAYGFYTSYNGALAAWGILAA